MEKDLLISKIVDATKPPRIERKDWRIACIGSGFIMRDCHLRAYQDIGLQPIAIASRQRKNSQSVADQYQIPNVYDTWMEMLQNDAIEIVDIAIPPDKQLEVVEEACRHPNIKGILCQKPVAMNLQEARRIAELAEQTGKKIAVNSNMRYDQSMRALKYLLDQRLLGDPVLATIEMRAIPHWQEFLKQYDRLELYGMGIHHIDIFRFLFGDPEDITAICRTDPRTQFPHRDGITQYTYKYADDLMCTSLDDVWAGPNEPCEKDIYIKWRVEGTEGMAKGTIGWPMYPAREPSTLVFTCKQYPNQWIEPKWDQVWFPDAFQGTMSSLLAAIEQNQEPEISIADNVNTIGCVEACYQSIESKMTVRLDQVLRQD